MIFFFFPEQDGMKQLPGQIAFPEDNEVERLFRLVPGLNRWDMTDVMPFHNYPSVREARGLLGESFFSGFQKVLTREYWHEPRQVLEIAVYFSLLSEGNAGAVHGGAIAATFDHSFGRCLLRSIGFGSNATLNLGIDYKKFVPIDTVVRISCEPAVRDGRKVTLVGHVCLLCRVQALLIVAFLLGFAADQRGRIGRVRQGQSALLRLYGAPHQVPRRRRLLRPYDPRAVHTCRHQQEHGC